MSEASQIFKLSAHQRRAANPGRSVWVTASAGTGKTRVLASRIARLLLDGCKPHRILALTFTNAAAAEMADRVSRTLADWTVMEEAKLAETLHDLTGERPAKDRIDEARRRFAALLDDPIGLRAHTIHGFCQSLLRRFPVEADVPPHFTLIDERTQQELLDQASDAVLSREGGSDGLDREALETLADFVDLDKAQALAKALLREGDRLAALPNDTTRLLAGYERLLDLEPGQTEEAVIAAACSEGVVDGSGLAKAAEQMLTGSSRYVEHGRTILNWLAMSTHRRQAAFAAYASVFDRTDRSLLTNAMREAWPPALGVVDAERSRTRAVVEKTNSVVIGRLSAALARFARAVGLTYGRLKRQRAYLDYDDLIAEATKLLTRAEARAWVLYKLDGGLDHILVDEAQDNSRAQWRIFRALAEELVSGLGAAADRDGPAARSLFIVGDPKQSIYRFQGAAPDAFHETQSWIDGQLAQAPAEAGLDSVELTTSFRSAEPVLSFVDAVLADQSMPEGAFPALSPHRAHDPSDKPGLVEIWPLVRQAPKVKPEPWALPDRYDVSERAEQRLAEGVADQIAGLTKDTRTPVRAQDILVLVKKRSAFATTLINALKNRGIPVEGADRLSLTDELAVRDLLVLADFLLQRDDDLALATVLRGPLIGLTEDQLFELAYDRGEESLWHSLAGAAANDARLGDVQTYLAALLADVDFVTPHSLFSAILSNPCPADKVSSRRAMTARLGRPINDPVDELLSQTLAFEANHAPSLQGFQHWLRLSDEPLKRAAGEQPAGVRVMTIHGAKGLEANTVILADIDSRPPPDDALYWFESGDGGPALPLWRPVKDVTCGLLEQRHSKRQGEDSAEDMRLLYVALTRAEQRLLVCGTGPAEEKNDKPQRWYHYCERAMERLDPTRKRPFQVGDDGHWAGEAIRYALREELFAAHGTIEQEPPAPGDDHWSRRRAPAAEAQHIIRPSRWETDISEPAVISPTSQDGQNRFRRGLIIHTLLERLPALPPLDRQKMGRAYLNRPIHGLTDDQAEEYLAEALGVIDDPEFGPIFTAEALVEAPIVGQVGSRIINGQIDRMVIGDDEILIVDFKTNRPPPTDVDQTAPVYLRQMASYQAVLQQIYPDRAVKCALLWTVEPRLMPLPNSILAQALCNSGT